MEQISSNVFSNILNILNNSKLFSAFIMIIMNLGSKYISFDLCNFHEKILSSYIVRKIAIFAIFWSATRDLLLSLLLTIIFAFLISGLFNDKSFLSLIPKKKMLESKNIQNISDQEYEQAQKIVNIYINQKNKLQQDYNLVDDEENKRIKTYKFNKWRLKNYRLKK